MQPLYDLEQRKIDAEFNRIARNAHEKNRSQLQKTADWIQATYIALLIGRVSTMIKVGASGVVKQPLETLTRATTGQVAGLMFPSLKKAIRGEGFSLKQEQHRYLAHYAGIGEKGMQKRVEKSQKALDEADNKFEQVRQKGKDIEDKYGKDSPEYKKYIKEDLTKAVNNQQKALVGHLANGLYEWIGSNSWKDAANVFVHSASKIEELMGYSARENWKDLSTGNKIKFIIESVGATHAVLKNFSARAEFAASFVARLENKLKNGIDIRNADELLKTANESFINYQRGKYQDNNFISDAFKEVTKAVDRMGEKNPNYKQLGELTAAGARGKVPILKTPTNIAKDAILEYTFGLPIALAKHGGVAFSGIREAIKDGKGWGEFRTAMKDAISNLDADKADLIYRSYRKGGFALGMYALAATGVIGFGGFYNQDEKGKRNENYGKIYIGGVYKT